MISIAQQLTTLTDNFPDIRQSVAYIWLLFIFDIDSRPDRFYTIANGPQYDNPDFIKAFSQIFVSMAMSLNPNSDTGAADITPTQWSRYDSGNMEMVFNRTDAGSPTVVLGGTDAALSNRCK